MPRVRLCQVEPPRRSRSGRRCRIEPRRSRSSSAETTVRPAAASTRSPSAWARSASSSAASPWAKDASTPLPRFITSLRRFIAMMSARSSDSIPAARRSAATAAVVASVPPGKRPTSRIAGVGWHDATTTPGSRWVAGSMTQTAYVLANSRSAAASVAMPLVAQTTGTSAGAWARRSASATAAWWDFTASSTTVSSVHPTSAAVSVAGASMRWRPSPASSTRPPALMASRCAPRATSVTACPARASVPPTTPPTAPAP